MSTLNINKVVGEYDSELGVALNYNYISKDMKVGAEGLTLNTESYKAIKKKLSKTFKMFSFEKSNFMTNEVMEGEEAYIVSLVSKNKDSVTVNIYAKDNQLLEKYYNIFRKGNINDTVYASFKNMYATNTGIDYTDSVKYLKDFQYLDNDYYPYLDVNEMFEQFLISDSNILFLYGEPGTGKTKLADSYIKFLMEKADTKDVKKELLDKFVFNDEYDNFVSVMTVKNEDLLAGDALWNELITNSYSLVFLDDLDYLLPRTNEVNSGKDVQNNKFISQFLSFTEGINKNNDKTKFIITTNRNAKEIDEALLRKGRCFEILNLRALKADEALSIWTKYNLNKSTFKEVFGNKRKIVQCDLADEIKKHINQEKYGHKFKPYLKEEGISHINKINVEKRVGFNG